MVQLQITIETMNRMKKIIGTNTVHYGDFMINELIDMFEKNKRNLS